MENSISKKLKYALPKLKLCLVNEGRRRRPLLSVQGPDDVALYLDPLRFASEEHFVSLHLNAKNEVLGIHEVSHGSLAASLVHPREVFKAAILANSFAIIVCHNHPSGSSVSPSKEDLDTTAQLLSAGKLLGISLIDHLIVGPSQKRNTAYSLRENYPQIWAS